MTPQTIQRTQRHGDVIFKHGRAAVIRVLLAMSLGMLITTLGLYAFLLQHGTGREQFVTFDATILCPRRHDDSRVTFEGYYSHKKPNTRGNFVFSTPPILSKNDSKSATLTGKYGKPQFLSFK